MKRRGCGVLSCGCRAFSPQPSLCSKTRLQDLGARSSLALSRLLSLFFSPVSGNSTPSSSSSSATSPQRMNSLAPAAVSGTAAPRACPRRRCAAPTPRRPLVASASTTLDDGPRHHLPLCARGLASRGAISSAATSASSVSLAPRRRRSIEVSSRGRERAERREKTGGDVANRVAEEEKKTPTS